MTRPKNLSRIILPNKKDVKFEGKTDDVSDGYHTFGELYEHRVELYLALCRAINWAYIRTPNEQGPAWKSEYHSDGSQIEGWFVLGLFERPGDQITYHIPLKYWTRCEFAQTKERAPEFDNHSPQDVLTRLKSVL